SKEQVEGYRNFATKLWNAARFCEHHQCRLNPQFQPEQAKLAINRWIMAEVQSLGQHLATQLDHYRFDEACSALYQFIWGQFCDWYLEFTKPIFFGENEEEKKETKAAAAWTLSQLLHLLHPFMPFVTEELWEHLFTPNLLMAEPWPVYADKVAQNIFS